LTPLLSLPCSTSLSERSLSPMVIVQV
jgi:hypothetical protein